jgi:hypothetical protein
VRSRWLAWRRDKEPISSWCSDKVCRMLSQSACPPTRFIPLVLLLSVAAISCSVAWDASIDIGRLAVGCVMIALSATVAFQRPRPLGRSPDCFIIFKKTVSTFVLFSGRVPCCIPSPVACLSTCAAKGMNRWGPVETFGGAQR